MSQNDLYFALLLAVISFAIIAFEPRLPPAMRQTDRALGTVVGLWMMFAIYLAAFRIIARHL